VAGEYLERSRTADTCSEEVAERRRMPEITQFERLNQIKLERPEKVEATQPEGFICVGGFYNPLF
jgi:hypothetical protein